jgi:hypothetical protein
MIPEVFGDSPKPALRSAGGDFAKWLRHNAPTIPVEVQKSDQRLVLRSADYWLPLVFLAGDVALPMYLNLVSNYIYEKMKGALKGDRTRIRFSAMYQDVSTGVIKRFDFDGDRESLKQAIKKLDPNAFFSD